MVSTILTSLITCCFSLPVYFHCALTSQTLRGIDLLVEGFSSSANSEAVITNLAFSHANFKTMLVSLEGVAMHISTLTNYYKPLTTFIPNSSQVFASRLRLAALSLATKCSIQCAANLTSSPADSLALAKSCTRFYLSHFGVS